MALGRGVRNIIMESKLYRGFTIEKEIFVPVDTLTLYFKHKSSFPDEASSFQRHIKSVSTDKNTGSLAATFP